MNAYVNLDTGKVLRIYLLVTVNYFANFSENVQKNISYYR